MGRLLLFLLGLLVGGALVSLLYENGSLHARTAPIAATAPAAPANAVVLPSLPAEPASASLATPPAAPLPLPAPDPSESTLAQDEGNASEQTQASSPEATAAVAAAQAVGGTQLLLPVQGVTSAQLVDTYTQSRGAGRLHDAIDIMAARDTPVFAVADGRVAKLFTSVRGGLTVYQFD
ncbi:MAG: M23 family peptidase, partial [Arenimonas sp.]